VGILSNFLGLKDGRGPVIEQPTVIRPTTPAEIPDALRLVLGSQGTAVHEQHVQEFLTFAQDRHIDLGQIWVAEQAGKLTLAALPVPSPGRTMLVFTSAVPNREAEKTIARLIDATCADSVQRGGHLAQALIDPADEALRRVYISAGFAVMAELIYLNGTPHPQTSPPPLPLGMRWDVYTPENHSRFTAAIMTSYEESLDCPALNGLREMDDVIEGHKASGVFEPKHWLLLCEEDQTLGVLLLADTGRGGEALELVYLGLSKVARGRKLGELMMKQAMAAVVAGNFQRLSLAVDAKNVPALKLYYRHGMNRVTSKLALMRDLRRH
jgi:ribosomal protein S18 acetylase RimI-like enzyme